MKEDIKSLLLPELKEQLQAMGEPAFRAGQVYTCLREKLAEAYEISVPKVERKQVSAKDGTRKYLWRLSDGNCVETVLMRYRYGNSVCISSQVGCRMGCAFCASTLGGLVRSEFFPIVPAFHMVTCPEGLIVSMRHISLSTCGLVPRIGDLAKENLQLTLSVSLHAPNDTIRSSIMPVNRAYHEQELLDACRAYFEATGRRISFEYAMIRSVNDSVENAKELAARLKGMAAHVNLIPLNNVDESPLKPSSRQTVEQFQKTLESLGVTTTVRRSLGGDIDASCGQLRRKQILEAQ